MAGVAFIALTSFNKANLQTNTDPLATWDKEVLKQANTAASVTYLNEEEKKLIYYTNLCRLKPKLFCQTVLADYLKSHPDITDGVASLKVDLNANKALKVLVPDKELCTEAHDFAKKMGEEGKEGHLDFQARMKPIMKRFNKVGENCNYGETNAIDAFMSLLIDWSDPENLGHRKNLMDPDFTSIGVSREAHKVYKWNFVMDFAGN